MEKILIKNIKPFKLYQSGTPWAGLMYRLEHPHAGEYQFGIDKKAGVFEGSPETGGMLYVMAEVGSIITWGQQGIQYNRTGESYARIKPDKSLEVLPGRAAANDALLATPAKDAGVAKKEVTVVTPKAKTPPPAPKKEELVKPVEPVKEEPASAARNHEVEPEKKTQNHKKDKREDKTGKEDKPEKDPLLEHLIDPVSTPAPAVNPLGYD